MATPVYRLILFTPRSGYPEGGSWDTGGTYEGCSLANTGPCQAVQFNHLADAVNYANSHGEIPVQVPNEQMVWDIIDGKVPITDDMIVRSVPTQSSVSGLFGGMNTNTLLMIGGALLLLPLFFGKKKSSSEVWS